MKSALPNRTLDQVTLDTMQVITKTLKKAGGMLPRSVLRKPCQHMPFENALHRLQVEGKVEVLNNDQSASNRIVRLLVESETAPVVSINLDRANSFFESWRSEDHAPNAVMLNTTIEDIVVRTLPVSLDTVGNFLVAKFPPMVARDRPSEEDEILNQVIIGNRLSTEASLLQTLEMQCKERMDAAHALATANLSDMFVYLSRRLEECRKS